LEGRAVAIGELAAQRQCGSDGLRSRLGLDPLQRRRRKVKRRDLVDRRAELAVLGFAERCALLGQLALGRRRQGHDHRWQCKEHDPEHMARLHYPHAPCTSSRYLVTWTATRCTARNIT